MERDRLLLNIRTIDVSYRSALRHAPASGLAQQEWLGAARQRAEQMLNALESRVLRTGPVDPPAALQFRIVRERIRLADAVARGLDRREDAPAEVIDPAS
jgi:hypothetical protein